MVIEDEDGSPRRRTMIREEQWHKNHSEEKKRKKNRIRTLFLLLLMDFNTMIAVWGTHRCIILPPLIIYCFVCSFVPTNTLGVKELAI